MKLAWWWQMPITDAVLVEELCRLGNSYGVSVFSFGLSSDKLASLHPASTIAEVPSIQFEEITDQLQVTTVSSVPVGPLDWEHIRDMTKQSFPFGALLAWISRCLKDKRHYPFTDFAELQRIEQGDL